MRGVARASRYERRTDRRNVTDAGWLLKRAMSVAWQLGVKRKGGADGGNGSRAPQQ